MRQVSQRSVQVLACAGAALRGRLTTAHGEIDTPVFMPGRLGGHG
jgi:queuine/archaeosine tRNA-ribosyltransferase